MAKGKMKKSVESNSKRAIILVILFSLVDAIAVFQYGIASNIHPGIAISATVIVALLLNVPSYFLGICIVYIVDDVYRKEKLKKLSAIMGLVTLPAVTIIVFYIVIGFRLENLPANPGLLDTVFTYSPIVTSLCVLTAGLMIAKAGIKAAREKYNIVLSSYNNVWEKFSRTCSAVVAAFGDKTPDQIRNHEDAKLSIINWDAYKTANITTVGEIEAEWQENHNNDSKHRQTMRQLIGKMEAETNGEAVDDLLFLYTTFLNNLVGRFKTNLSDITSKLSDCSSDNAIIEGMKPDHKWLKTAEESLSKVNDEFLQNVKRKFK